MLAGTLNHGEVWYRAVGFSVEASSASRKPEGVMARGRGLGKTGMSWVLSLQLGNESSAGSANGQPGEET